MKKKSVLKNVPTVLLHIKADILAQIDADIAARMPIIRSRREWFDDLLARHFAAQPSAQSAKAKARVVGN